MVIEGSRTKDPKEIAENPNMKQGGFSVRMTVLPISPGRVCLWMGAAPGTPDMIKEAAGANGANEYSGSIPTVCISLRKKANEVMGGMVPKEKDLGLARKWVMYPLLM